MNDNANNWITSLSHAVGQAPPLAAFGYAYDNEGNNLYEEKLHQPGNSEAYGYDTINRLTDYRVGALSGNTVASPLTQSAWNLDSVGNWNSRVKDGATELRSHSAANAITMISGVGVTSDNNGNVTQDLQNQYQYDEGNRLVLVAQASVPVGNYAYDALGRRISKTTAAGTTVFYYDAARIIEERVGSATTASYVYGNYIDEVLAKDSGSQRVYYHQNALWSVHALSDANGAVVERYSYDAYGSLSVLSPTYELLSTPPLAYFTFTGREFDAECGIFHYRARAHSPSLGRFLQRDPLGYVDGMNLYEYVKSNPTDAVDPLGTGANDVSSASISTPPCCNGLVYDPKESCCIDRKLISRTETEEVTLSFRKANLPTGATANRVLGKRHVSVRTSYGETGQGKIGAGVPGQGAEGYAYTLNTEMIDHSGESRKPDVINIKVTVKKCCFFERVGKGTATGAWIPGVNDCNTIMKGAVKGCGGDWDKAYREYLKQNKEYQDYWRMVNEAYWRMGNERFVYP